MTILPGKILEKAYTAMHPTHSGDGVLKCRGTMFCRAVDGTLCRKIEQTNSGPRIVSLLRLSG